MRTLSREPRQPLPGCTSFVQPAGEGRPHRLGRSASAENSKMNRHLWRAAALILAIGLHSQAARAEEHSIWSFLFGNQDPRLTATGIAVGVGADAGSYALYHKHGSPPTRIASPGMAYAITAYGCAVVYPILATIVVQRPLTPREAYVGFAN